MKPTDFSGVFSRYFVVGFFLPSFVALVGLDQVLSTVRLLPDDVGGSIGREVLVLGAGSLILALVLLGVHGQVLRLFGGYPLSSRTTHRVVGPLARWMRRRHTDRYRAMVEQRETLPPGRQRTVIATRLDRRYPTVMEQILPTSFGNTVRAFEHHGLSRWGLATTAVWPRIGHLLSTEEQELISDSRANVAFFINSALLAIGVGAALVLDAILSPAASTAVYFSGLLFAAVAYATYRAAVGAAEEWGTQVRAAVDVHRLEVLKALGVRIPTSDLEERSMWRAVNRCLLWGEPLPDEIRATGTTDVTASEPTASSTSRE